MKDRIFFNLSNILLFFFYLSLTTGNLTFQGIKFNYFMTGLNVLFYGVYFLLSQKNIRYRFFRRLPFIFFLFWIFIAFFYGFIYPNSFMYTSLNQVFSIVITIFISSFYLYFFRDVKSALIMLVFVFLINLTFGFYNTLSGVHFVYIDPDHFRYTNYFPSGFYGQPNDYITLIVVCFFSLNLLFVNRKYSFLVIILSSLPVIYLIEQAASRSALLAVLVFISLHILLSILIVRRLIYRFRLLFGLLIFLFIVVFIFIYALQFDFILNIYNYYFYSESNISSDIYRLESLYFLLNGSINHFFFPNGPGSSLQLIGNNPHNLIAELLYEYGIIVMFLYVSSLFFYLFRKRVDLRKLQYYVPYSLGMLLISLTSSSVIREKVYWLVIFLVFFNDTIKRNIKTNNYKVYEV